MRRTTTMLVLTVLLMLGSPAVLPAAAQQGGNNPAGLLIPIGGVVTGTLAGVFQGTANITDFAVVDGALVAVGTLTGTVTNSAGQIVQSIAATFTAPVAPPPPAGTVCSILNLVLGPIDLNVLGIMVETNTIILNVTAAAGTGLGSLVCRVVSLLEEVGSLRALNRVANLLDVVLANI